ncbi:hypothetical protein [Laspinema palackyanum]|uniref:hypothetical protein n=1 Tax=Laspinema palackyanum TaxID=3231601 RepID=UPI00345DE55D|nr:hypothetical protein [Laspinema sp. D2c]
MRHINFQVSSSGEVISLDGFNRDHVLTKALIGDSTATLKLTEVQWQFRDYANYTVPGMPVMDSEIFTAMDLLSSGCSPVFWFPATEMHGVLRKEEIINLMSLDWNNRFIEFLGKDRYCYGDRQFLRASLSDADLLLQNYLEIVTALLEQYPNLYLVPVVSRFLGSKVPVYFRAYSSLTKFDRCLNLDWLDPDKSDYWLDDQGHLSVLAWTILREQLEAV